MPFPATPSPVAAREISTLNETARSKWAGVHPHFAETPRVFLAAILIDWLRLAA
jgi:hypothetical protein